MMAALTPMTAPASPLAANATSTPAPTTATASPNPSAVLPPRPLAHTPFPKSVVAETAPKPASFLTIGYAFVSWPKKILFATNLAPA